MAKQITARRKGDDYQALFFWLQALDLVVGDQVEQVTLEFEGVNIVDDVVTRYNVPSMQRDTRFWYDIDWYQCKYHVAASCWLDTTFLIYSVILSLQALSPITWALDTAD